MKKILDTGFDPTLRPLRYPQLWQHYKNMIGSFWTPQEIEYSIDIVDLERKATSAEKHMIKNLLAFFAAGDQIVSDNLVLSYYRHLNSAEARMALGVQLFQEQIHIETYLEIMDHYVKDLQEQAKLFDAVNNHPIISAKEQFCRKYTDFVMKPVVGNERTERHKLLLSLMVYASCVEGLAFMSAFSYVFYLRDRGLFPGLAAANEFIMRDESEHCDLGCSIVQIIRDEYPDLFDTHLKDSLYKAVEEAVRLEDAFCDDVLSLGVGGLSKKDMESYTRYIADQRLEQLGYAKIYNSRNPLSFMKQQGLSELTNFFERRSTSYSVGHKTTTDFDFGGDF